MYQAAVEVLREEGLVVAMQDYRFGRIASEPFAAGTIAEPWRKAGQTLRQAARSTLNSQRRVVTVTIESTTGGEGEAKSPLAKVAADQARRGEGDYLVRVEVSIEQLQVPRRYLTGSTTGRSLFGHLSSVPAELEERGITSSYWQPVGTDPYMEQHLLEQIVRRSVDVQAPGEGDSGSAPGLDTTEAPPTEELIGQ